MFLASLFALPGGAVGAGSEATEVADAFIGQVIVEVHLVSAGRAVMDEAVHELVETKIGQPLSMHQARESLTHLFSTGRFGGVQVGASALRGGVALLYELRPFEVIERIEFHGELGLSRKEMYRAIAESYGATFQIAQVDMVAETLHQLYRERGFLAPQVRTLVEGGGARQVLRIDVESGERTTIDRLVVRGVLSAMYPLVIARLGLRSGMLYDGDEINRRLGDYEADLRRRRFYEARLKHDVEISLDGGSVNVLLDIQRGPRVTVVFAGDEIPGDAPLDLVPVEREASVDEDLLEDADRRIAAHLHALGYRDAVVTHARRGTADGLSIVFTVDRGRAYEIVELTITGAVTVSHLALEPLIGVEPGDPLVMLDLEAGLAAIGEYYRRRGFATVRVEPVISEVSAGGVGDDRPALVTCEVAITEGERTSIRSIVFEGSTAWSAEDLLAVIKSPVGGVYYAPQVVEGRDVIRLIYFNEGYEQAVVSVESRFDNDLRAVDLIYRVREGSQVLVDHILIVGNEQVKSETIRRELALEPGSPLGLDDVAETRRRLNALGMFRRVDIREFSHGRADRRDVVIVVDEAPTTRLAYGGGGEVSQRLRRVGSQAVERIEFAPRGFFEIGRRNLWGKNRSINFFTRVSVRRKNDPTDPIEAAETSTLGFNEYRILGTYSEPRTFGLDWDVLVSGFVEQAIRPGFDLFSRGFTAQITRQFTPAVSTTVGYRLGQNDTFNIKLNPEDESLVERLFPDVRLSSFSASQFRDTRDDPFNPTYGTLLGIDTEVAARSIGSEVGFSKTFLQGFVYRTVPGTQRFVFAGGARVGVAVGFPRSQEVLPGLQGERLGSGTRAAASVTREFRDLPLPPSERFFAGGDTTVRGFALDRLGDPIGESGGTIDPDGFPQGGNAMIILNGELRVGVTRDLGLVIFLDAGNVYDRLRNMSLRRLRGGAGFGIRYSSPVGPIRVDLGFKLGRRREFDCGDQKGKECLTALHISIGQAF